MRKSHEAAKALLRGGACNSRGMHAWVGRGCSGWEVDQPSRCREAARDRIDRVLGERHGDDQRNRCVRGCGWHSATTSTGQYQVIASNKLKITEELGSAVLDYHVDGARLVLSGDGLEQILGKAEPPQTLNKTSQ